MVCNARNVDDGVVDTRTGALMTRVRANSFIICEMIINDGQKTWYWPPAIWKHVHFFKGPFGNKVTVLTLGMQSEIDREDIFAATFFYLPPPIQLPIHWFPAPNNSIHTPWQKNIQLFHNAVPKSPSVLITTE